MGTAEAVILPSLAANFSQKDVCARRPALSYWLTRHFAWRRIESMAQELPRPISPQLAQIFGLCADLAETDGRLLERFQVQQDAEAFAALMRRHGPLVFGVCRRVLGNAHEAEDVFQATFLLLVRKITSIRKQTSVASWLARVSYRLALAAKIRAERRRVREQVVASREEVAMSDPASREWWAVLDEELNRLPEKYHAPLVLCYLQGKTGEEAARELGWPRGTVAGRLARARDLLRARLGRRGVVLGVGLASALPALPAQAAAAVPLELMQATCRHALHVAVGGSAAALPSEVGALMKEGMSFLHGKLKIVALVTAVLGVVGVSLVMANASRRPTATAVAPGALQAALPVPAAAAPAGDEEPLPQGAVARIGSSRFATPQCGYQVAFTPSGKLVAATDWGNAISVWNGATGREVHRFAVNAGDTVAVAFSADEKILISVGVSKLRRWDLTTGKQLAEHPVVPATPQASQTRGVFSVDATRVAVAATGTGAIRVYDTASGEEIRQLNGDANGIYAMAFSADGKALVSSGADRTIRLWDLTTGKGVRQFGAVPAEDYKHLQALAISSDGKRLATVRAGKDPVIVWDVTTGAKLYDIEPQDQVVALAFTKDGKTLAYGCRDRYTVHVCDAATGKAARQFKLAYGHGAALALAPDGKTLLAPGATRLHLYDVAKGEELAVTRGPDGRVAGIAFSPDGKTIATANAPVTLWKVADGRELRQFPHNVEDLVRTVAFSPNGRYLAWAKSGKTLCLWDVVANREARELGISQGGTFAIAFSGDSKTLAALGGNTVHVWDVERGQVLHERRGVFCWGGFALTSDGKMLATESEDHKIHVWELATGKERFEFAGLLRGETRSMAFSPDGKQLVLAGQDAKVRCVAVENGKEVQSFDTVGSNNSAVAISPDGKLLVAANHKEAVVRIWDRATGKELPALRGHRAAVLALAFSADGKYLASAGSEGSTLIWDVGRFQPAGKR
jgi:RNA polymerase sigma factor (sigma-70 family)